MKMLAELPQPARQIADAIIAGGGRAVLVGGAVRDQLLGITPKDFDIESYGLNAKELTAALMTVAKVHAVGKSFGVHKTKIGGMEIDVSLPRRERKVGQGHRGFEVDHDQGMSFAEAALRRDFTINAIGMDLGTGELLDPWGGVTDLESCIIRHVSDAFGEDPLRVLRACQFSARFGFAIAEETVVKCRGLQGELATLSTERIWGEFKKLLLKSWKPSIGILAMESTGALELFPELAQLRSAPHNPESHPEGDVWIHNNLVLDACAAICRKAKLNENSKLVLMLAALCHDLGKPLTATLIDGVWRNPGHELAGDAPSRALLRRIGCPHSMVERIIELVREHGQPYQLWRRNLSQSVEDGAIRRLALRVPIIPLSQLVLADFRGRATADAMGPCSMVDWLLERAASLGVVDNPPRPILQGRDLQFLGMKSGPEMGGLLKKAFEAQLDGEFGDLPSALAWVQSRIENHPT
jgi:tRNA nucleotidyltransferase (CCA-adding enzyme)